MPLQMYVSGIYRKLAFTKCGRYICRLVVCNYITNHMKQSINNFSKVLCALMVCVGLVFSGCTEGPLGGGDNTEHDGNDDAEEMIVPVVPLGYANLSETSTANCYIVSQSGSYCLLVAKGNQNDDLLHRTKSAAVLWEAFPSSTSEVGDLIKSVLYKDGYIVFQTADIFKKGNALIAAKDAYGTVLWSWHVWFTDQPEGQEYYHNAGTMMDRDLGATENSCGGLLYQWGRKDPFLCYKSTQVQPTIGVYNHTINSEPNTGTIEYSISNPTVFITKNSYNSDWFYTGSSLTDNTRWTESSNEKSIYDPCPAGWRVPDGGSNGVWATSLGSSSELALTNYGSSENGINFSGIFGSSDVINYPEWCMLDSDDGGVLDYEYAWNNYWSATNGCSFNWSVSWGVSDDYYPILYPSIYSSISDIDRAAGLSIRCIQE